MTELRKRISRRSGETIRDRGKFRRVVVTLYPSGVIGLRLERCRREEVLSIRAAWEHATKLRVASEQRDRPRKRRVRVRRRLA